VCVQRRWFHQQEVKLIWRKQSCPPSLTSFENKNGSWYKNIPKMESLPNKSGLRTLGKLKA
jgi:hypothetical protein